jgi:hypothetical protein
MILPDPFYALKAWRRRRWLPASIVRPFGEPSLPGGVAKRNKRELSAFFMQKKEIQNNSRK